MPKPTIKVEVIKRHTRGRFVLRWPGHEQYAVATTEQEAYREAFTLEQRLNNPTHEILSWEAACEAYENWHLSLHSKEHRGSWRTARRAFEKFCKGSPPDLPDITNHQLAEFAVTLTKSVAMTTARTYCQYLRSFFSWCHDQEWIDRVPRVKLPQRKRGEQRAKGRPLTGEEYERLVDAIPKIVGETYAPSWRFLVDGLWETSLRLNEAVRLHWTDGPIRINIAGQFPMIDFDSDGDKGGRTRQLPITREFRAMLDTIPQRGFVFRPELSKGVTRSRDTWSHRIGDMGEKAGIVVDINKRTGRKKFASAHDLRRSFLERWRNKIDATMLQVLARHESLDTTQRYYLGDHAQMVAAMLWS